MRHTITSLLLLAPLLLGASCGRGTRETTAAVDSTRVPTASQYLNPVLGPDFPDPTVIRATDGLYYAYATETTDRRLQVARSMDLVSWTRLAEGMPVQAGWARAGANFFAPDVHERDGQFVLYYASEVADAAKLHPDDGFCIGMATSASPAGPFTDAGAPVTCGPTFTTIDAMGFDDPQSGKRYLYWGSAGRPIVVQELAADRKSFAAGSAPVALVSPRTDGPDGYDRGLIEGPWVTYHAPWYYLFFSGNNCCGTGAHYALMVARATSPTGPFTVLTVPGSPAAQPVLQAGSRWSAPGHNSVVQDAAGTDWLLYHAIDSRNPYLIPGRTDISRRPMLLDRIDWVDGWPRVAGGTPSESPQERPAR